MSLVNSVVVSLMLFLCIKLAWKARSGDKAGLAGGRWLFYVGRKINHGLEYTDNKKFVNTFSKCQELFSLQEEYF